MRIEKDTAIFPISFSIAEDGEGVPGLAPTLAIRNALTGDYFDFSDSTFKASGWVTQFATMVDVLNGNYQYDLPVAATAALVVGAKLAAEYHFDDGSGFVGDAMDPVEIVRVDQDASIARKMLANRKKEVAGNPGTLTTYDDDGVTPFRVGDLTDKDGGEVTAIAGAPAEYVPQ